MGYEVNSPVKQVWLPLDYHWLEEVLRDNEMKFGAFAEKYKEKYGIDLHDIFESHKNVDDQYYIGLKVDSICTYGAGIVDNVFETKLSDFSPFINFSPTKQSEAEASLLLVEVANKTGDFGHGFEFILPVTGNTINDIDDINVVLYEI